MRANREAIDRWRIVPRVLRGITRRDHRSEQLGLDLPAPILLAPVGCLSIVHHDAERAVARAAAELGLPMVASTAASTAMDELVDVAPDAPRRCQIYVPRDRELAASFLARAEPVG